MVAKPDADSREVTFFNYLLWCASSYIFKQKLFICLINVCCLRGFPSCSVVKNPPAKQETQVRSLGQEDPLEKEMTTDSSILAQEIPWTEEPSRLVMSMSSQRVEHVLANKQQQQQDAVSDPTQGGCCVTSVYYFRFTLYLFFFIKLCAWESDFL